MSEKIVDMRHILIGRKKLGIMTTVAELDNGTLIRGASLVINSKIVGDIAFANDGGWYGDDGKIYNFYYDKAKHALFIRWFAISFKFLRKRKTL